MRFIQAGLACCGVEAAGISEHNADLVTQAGATIADPDEAANILVVAGTLTTALAPVIKSAFDQLAEPRVVVAFGVCAITGGPYWDSYSVLPGAAQVVPVDINVPGCPPSPSDLRAALTKASELVNSGA